MSPSLYQLSYITKLDDHSTREFTVIQLLNSHFVYLYRARKTPRVLCGVYGFFVEAIEDTSDDIASDEGGDCEDASHRDIGNRRDFEAVEREDQHLGQ